MEAWGYPHLLRDTLKFLEVETCATWLSDPGRQPVICSLALLALPALCVFLSLSAARGSKRPSLMPGTSSLDTKQGVGGDLVMQTTQRRGSHTAQPLHVTPLQLRG